MERAKLPTLFSDKDSLAFLAGLIVGVSLSLVAIADITGQNLFRLKNVACPNGDGHHAFSGWVQLNHKETGNHLHNKHEQRLSLYRVDKMATTMLDHPLESHVLR